MLSYETLDVIADAYNPSLALISLAFVVAGAYKARWKLAAVRLSAFVAVALVAYGLMFLDSYLNIWHTFGLDYSTHTAVSLGLIIFLCFTSPKLTPVWIGSFISYALLMLYQRYHTLSDIATTGIVVSVPVSLVMAYLHTFKAANPMFQGTRPTTARS